MGLTTPRIRATLGSAFLFVSQSFIFGVSVMPALLFWQLVLDRSNAFPWFDPYGRQILVAMSLIPAYFIFAMALMFLSAGWNRLAGWRTEPGSFIIHEYSWPVVRWASYNASIHIVRVFCGEVMRTTPIWTYYLKANGASIESGVYVNSARLFDHNLLIFGEKAVVGGDAKLIAHLVERGRLVAQHVRIGHHAVVGVNSVIGPGVRVGEGSVVGAMSYVPKGTVIPPHEAWGGVPARLIKRYAENELEEKGQPGIPIVY